VKTNKKRLIVFGLDCAAPELVFEKFKEHLPNISRLMDAGTYGILKSTTPPITVPAWTSMVSGKDPGELGIYGFRNRMDHSYDKLEAVNGSYVTVPRVWDVLNQHGYRCITVGIPQTFPPRISNGIMISGFMTPSPEFDYTFPEEYKTKISNITDDYKLDVTNFRTMDKDSLILEVADMTRNRFSLIRHMIKHEEWDFLMMVEIGLDRMHHVFWEHLDAIDGNDKYDSKYQNTILDYYKLLDKEIGMTLDLLPEETGIAVVSDHGAKTMKGGICINEWLRQEGLLVLKEENEGVGALNPEKIDWSRTKAWGAGGYYGRIFLNVKDREPMGVIEQNAYNDIRVQIKRKIVDLPDDQGKKLDNKVFFAEDIYRKVEGIPPDMLIYFDDLNWRSIGTVGHNKIYIHENDNGVDNANHSSDGIYIFKGMGWDASERNEQLPITDIFTRIVSYYGIN